MLANIDGVRASMHSGYGLSFGYLRLINRAIFGMPGSSPHGATNECVAIMVSVKVVPERGIPTINIGFGLPSGIGLACFGPSAV